MCPSIIDYYVQHPELLDGICLAEFASSYTKKGIKHKNQQKSFVIRYVKYNKHRDLDNYYREQLMLYAPYRVDENCFKEQYLTWNNAYMELQDVIKQNEQKFTYKTTKRWGDLEDASNELD